jgi:hypothetical protein
VDAFVDSCGDATPPAKNKITPKRPAATPRRKRCAHARSRQVPMHANARQRDLVPLRASAERQRFRLTRYHDAGGWAVYS